MSRPLIALLTLGFCLMISSAQAFTFSGTDPLTIRLGNVLIRKTEGRYCTAISGLKGYVVATPDMLKEERVLVYLESESHSRIVSFKGHYMNAVQSARYDAKSKTLKLIGHINPQVSLSIDYTLADKKVRVKELR